MITYKINHKNSSVFIETTQEYITVPKDDERNISHSSLEMENNTTNTDKAHKSEESDNDFHY